jgi:hypothetical protein
VTNRTCRIAATGNLNHFVDLGGGPVITKRSRLELDVGIPSAAGIKGASKAILLRHIDESDDEVGTRIILCNCMD